MRLNRRQFLRSAAQKAGATALAMGAASASEADPDFRKVRQDFPWVENQTYLNCGTYHPLPVPSARAIERYTEYKVKGPGPDRPHVSPRVMEDVKSLYGKLINAKATELAFVQSTLAGENIIVGGLGLHRSGGNIVTDELHYHGGVHIYRELAKTTGLELRIVRQKNWQTRVADFEKLVDQDTRLIAITLVSNLNGYLQDAKALSDLAHAHGAYLYADVVQAAGCIPMDVRKMGIDFCSAGTYKWLMGLTGLGFLYVREELLDRVKPSQFGEQYTNFKYHNFPGSPSGDEEVSYDLKPGAAIYEIGAVPFIAIACQQESLKYIHKLRISNIRRHVKPLTDRLWKEVPKLGYPTITPPDTPTPLVAFQVKDPELLTTKLRRAKVNVKVKWKQMRVTPSVFNNQDDIDRLLEAIA